VEIDRKVTCKSYEPDKVKVDRTIKKGNMFDVAKDMADVNLKSVPLDCMATECLYNREKKCHANGITVTDDLKADCADCVTYIKK